MPTTYTPIIGATDWAAEVESPWVIVNKMARMLESMARHGIVEDRDLTAPPGSCSDGACYLIAAGATGAWASHDGQMAIAVGGNASNGWYFVVVALEGVTLGVRDENIDIRHNGTGWVTSGSSIANLNDLNDVDITTPGDGDQLYYDLTNDRWFNGPPVELSLPVESFVVALGDETTEITAGTGKVTFRMPYAATLTDVRGMIVDGPGSGSEIIIDVNMEGASILSTKLHIDPIAQTSVGSSTPVVISNANLTDDAKMTIDIDDPGDSAVGVKITFYWQRIA